MNLNAALPQHPYRLADHVRACSANGQVILLDLKRSRYLGLGAGPSFALQRLIDGWPHIDAHIDPPAPVIEDSMRKPLESMAAQGLLIKGGRPSLRPDTTATEAADASIDVQDAAIRIAFSPVRVCQFIAASALTALQLRCCSLQTITDQVAARRNRQAHVGRIDAIDQLHDAVAAFEALRPLLFTARDKCLYDSLALIDFLGRQGLFPRWVVGVRTQPFAAHAWVQQGRLVLNDHHERVRPFTPILVV